MAETPKVQKLPDLDSPEQVKEKSPVREVK